MKRRTFVETPVTVPAFAVLGLPKVSLSQELEPITLPKPEKDGGKSVLASIQERRTTRNISPDFISEPEQRVLFAQRVGYPVQT